jgi:phosphatidylinositol alpha-1,6-mannosyltransferase
LLLDVVMPVSRATAAALSSRGMPTERLRVVPNAVDLGRFKGIAASRTHDEPFRIPGAPTLPRDAFLLVAVGRQVRRKGFAWFIDNVMPELPEQVVLWLAGDGPERDAIERAIRAKGLERRVHRLGKVSERELIALYRRGDLFVMPNIDVPGDMEGFGIVMLEAGACGLPTLAGDLEGIRDVIDDGVNGWLVPSGEAAAFASRIEALLEAPQELWAASARAAEHVSSRFRWDDIASQYLDALRV